MSTRCNAIFWDYSDAPLWFYRHSDGYPEGALPLLIKLLREIKKGKIRDSVAQACGWLIVYGHEEFKKNGMDKDEGYRWKVGSWEPTTDRHGDIEYLYSVDLNTKTITVVDTTGKKDKIIDTIKV